MRQAADDVKVVKESDFNAKKEEEKEPQIYGDGLSISDIVEYAERIRPRLRRGQEVDIAKKFKRYSSITRKIRKNYIRVLNLEGASFSGDDMSQTNFAMSHLKDTSFSGANLEGAVFAYADLTGADFSGANLKDTDFSRAMLEGANFSGAQLTNTNFYKAEIGGIKTLTPADKKKIQKALTIYRKHE